MESTKSRRTCSRGFVFYNMPTVKAKNKINNTPSLPGINCTENILTAAHSIAPVSLDIITEVHL